jgi:hypothetical protein
LQGKALARGTGRATVQDAPPHEPSRRSGTAERPFKPLKGLL